LSGPDEHPWEGTSALSQNEAERILQVYSHRTESELLYAPWRIDTAYMRAERTWLAAKMLKNSKAFPNAHSKCLEIGFGSMGWLAELLGWGVPVSNLHGIELDARRAMVASHQLPQADLRVGDASHLPWADKSFDLVVISTVLSSVLDQNMRRAVAGETVRVLCDGGVLLWYDMRRNNPWNSDIRKVTEHELRSLFPQLSGQVYSLTLVPQIARALAPFSIALTFVLARVPFLRTHLMAVLRKAQAADH